jgi:hypothetical protein
LWLLLLQYI